MTELLKGVDHNIFEEQQTETEEPEAAPKIKLKVIIAAEACARLLGGYGEWRLNRLSR